MNRRRVASGAVGGAIIGAVIATVDIIGFAVASVVAGIVVGLLATSDLDETSMEGLAAGGLTAFLLYLAGLCYVAFRAAESPYVGDLLYLLASYGYYVALFAFPLFAFLGLLGASVGRRVGRLVRPATA